MYFVYVAQYVHNNSTEQPTTASIYQLQQCSSSTATTMYQSSNHLNVHPTSSFIITLSCTNHQCLNGPIIIMFHNVPIITTSHNVPIITTSHNVPIIIMFHNVPIITTSHNVPIIITSHNVPIITTSYNVPNHHHQCFTMYQPTHVYITNCNSNQWFAANPSFNEKIQTATFRIISSNVIIIWYHQCKSYCLIRLCNVYY